MICDFVIRRSSLRFIGFILIAVIHSGCRDSGGDLPIEPNAGEKDGSVLEKYTGTDLPDADFIRPGGGEQRAGENDFSQSGGVRTNPIRAEDIQPTDENQANDRPQVWRVRIEPSLTEASAEWHPGMDSIRFIMPLFEGEVTVLVEQYQQFEGGGRMVGRAEEYPGSFASFTFQQDREMGTIGIPERGIFVNYERDAHGWVTMRELDLRPPGPPPPITIPEGAIPAQARPEGVPPPPESLPRVGPPAFILPE